MKEGKLPQKLIDRLDDADFFVSVEDNLCEVSKFSPAGQDFNFCVKLGKGIDEFIKNIRKCYEDFDISAEAYLWLDETGHGKNGAPYEMKDVCEDMEACEEIIYEFCDIVEDFRDENEADVMRWS